MEDNIIQVKPTIKIHEAIGLTNLNLIEESNNKLTPSGGDNPISSYASCQDNQIKNGQNEDRLSEERGENESTLTSVPYHKLFCYATRSDYIKIYCGCALAILTGCAAPIANYAFGILTKALVDLASNKSGCSIPVEHHNDLSPFMTKITSFVILNMISAGISFICGYLMVLCFNTVAENQAYQFRLKYFDSCLGQEIGWFDTNAKRDFSHRMIDDITKIQDAIGEKLGFCITTIASSCIFIAQSYYFGWKLSAVLSCVVPLIAVSAYYDATLTASLTANEQKYYESAGAVAEEVLANIHTVTAFNGQDKEVQRYDVNLLKARKFSLKKGIMLGLSNGGIWLITFLNYALGFWYGTVLILESRENGDRIYDSDTLVIVFFGILLASFNIAQSCQYFESFGIGVGAARGVFYVLNRIPEIEVNSATGLIPDKRANGEIEFIDVDFAYPSRPEYQVLKKLSFKISPGQTVALVGRSGCGKSTCIQLLQRFYNPTGGQIKIDDVNIQDLNICWVRSQMGLVGQEPVLFDCSIQENISCGKSELTLKDVQNAARSAYAHEFISNLSEKYKTRAGERGAQLSGGQKQRIAIARALIRNPAILLLDEATSALDNQSEAIVQAALERAKVGRSTIIVAHRLSTIQAASLIIAIDNGEVIESGTHAQLMMKGGLYHDLVMNQVKIGMTGEDGSREDEIINLDEKKESTPSIQDEISQITSKDSLVQQVAVRENKTLMKSFRPTRLMKMAFDEWPYWLCSTIATLIKSINIPVYAIVFGNYLAIFASQDKNYINKHGDFYSILYVVLAIMAGLSAFSQYFFITLAQNSFTLRIRQLIFRNLLNKDISFYDEPENTSGKLCGQLATDACSIQGASGTRFILFLQGIVTILLCAGLSLYFLPKLGAVVTFFFPFTILCGFLEGKILENDNVSEKVSIERAVNIAIEALNNMRTVSSLGMEKKFSQAYSKTLLKSHEINLRRSHIRGLVYAVVQALPYIAHSISMYYGAYLVENECANIADVFKISEALWFGASSGGAAFGYAPDYDKAKIAGARIFKLIDRDPLIDSSAQGRRLVHPQGKFDLKNISFYYPSRPISCVLKNVNIVINPGDKIAIVGPSGSGKSSLVSLILRFYDPQTGLITFDDVNFKSLNVSYLRSQEALVSQEPVLFDFTIAENISYGDNSRKVDIKEIMEVARMANAHNFIISLPAGYNTRVGSLGSQLSGGQKQRVCIARALVRNPKLLILDEATSALDTESEVLVQEALDNVNNIMTSVTISHRLTSIQNSSQIFVLKNGDLVECGTHQDLLEANGVYKNMWFTQLHTHSSKGNHAPQI